MKKEFCVFIKNETNRVFKTCVLIDGEEICQIGMGEVISLNLKKGKHNISFKNLMSFTKPLDFIIDNCNVAISLKMPFKTMITYLNY